MVFISKLNKILTVMISVLIIGGFLYGEKKKGFSGFEFSIGTAFPSFSNLAYKNDNAIGEAGDLLAFYESVGWKSSWNSTSGDFSNITYMVPVNAAAIFRINNQLIFKAGIELSLGESGSFMKYKIGDHENDISVIFKTKLKVSYFMPYIGVEYKLSKKISIYSSLGFGMSSLNMTETYDLKNGSDIYYLNKSKFTGNGNGIAITLGGKIEIRKDIFLKLEYFYYKPGSISGDLAWSEDSWKAGKTSGNISDDFYTYENYYPYSKQWVKNLGLMSVGPNVRNFEQLKLNFSSIRIMLGFYF